MSGSEQPGSEQPVTEQPVSGLSPLAQNYLKLIWAASEWGQEGVSVTELAGRLGVRPATVSDALRRLTVQGLLRHDRYGAIELTTVGRRHAIAMVRRHRLLETFLVETLGYTWDEVHDEADALEHAVSDRLIARIDDLLGHPTHDPHGDPIPSPRGRPRPTDAVPLADAPCGAGLVVRRVSDADAGLLRELAAHDVRPGARICRDDDTLMIGEHRLPLTERVAASIYVTGTNPPR